MKFDRWGRKKPINYVACTLRISGKDCEKIVAREYRLNNAVCFPCKLERQRLGRIKRQEALKMVKCEDR
jgi:hypothetical protein